MPLGMQGSPLRFWIQLTGGTHAKQLFFFLRNMRPCTKLSGLRHYAFSNVWRSKAHAPFFLSWPTRLWLGGKMFALKLFLLAGSSLSFMLFSCCKKEKEYICRYIFLSSHFPCCHLLPIVLAVKRTEKEKKSTWLGSKTDTVEDVLTVEWAVASIRSCRNQQPMEPRGILG